MDMDEALWQFNEAASLLRLVAAALPEINSALEWLASQRLSPLGWMVLDGAEVLPGLFPSFSSAEAFAREHAEDPSGALVVEVRLA